MGRPFDVAQYNYRGIAQLSECGIADNMLSLVLPEPTEGEQVFLLELAYKVGHSGDVPLIAIQDMDGLVLWDENMGATDTQVVRQFVKPGLPIPGHAKIVFSNTELSVARVRAHYQIM